MKKMIALLLAVAMLSCVLAGCGSKDSNNASDSKYSTVTPGVFTVATSPDYAPYEFYALGEDSTPALAGFDIALAQYIADYLGLKLEVIPMDFDGTLMELAAKNVDASMAGYSPDPDRLDKMDFSEIYYAGGQSFVTVKAKADLFTSLEDTNNADYQIGAQLASIQAELAEKFSPNADIITLGKATDLIAELLAGHLDGAYIETAVAESYSKNYPDLAIVLEVPDEQEGNVVGVSKDNEALLKGINEAIAAAIADGSINKFVAEANELASGNVYEGLLESED